MKRAATIAAALCTLAAAAFALSWKPMPDEAPASSGEVSLFVVGDVMPGRAVGRAMAGQGPGWLFAGVSEAVLAADVAVANLEAPIVAGSEVPDGAMSLRADPGVEKEIARAGFDLLSLANNHALDAGPEGLASTWALLEGQGMAHVGSGRSAAEARGPRIIEKNGLKISFFAYVDPAFTRVGDRALPDRAGLAFMDAEAMAADLAAAPPSDVVVVIMHAGEEYAEGPDPEQRAFARAAVDAGADLVIGHHPHVVQPAERYKDALILYSLGNFVFDQSWSEDASRGLAVDIRLGKEGVRKIAWRPVTIDASGRPAFAEGEALRKTLERVGPLALDAGLR